VKAVQAAHCSVVIPTRNRPDPLRDCLLSVARQTRLPSEIIIVDSSDDNATEELAGSLSAQFPVSLVYQRSAARSTAAQRNRGAEASRGDIILFLDDDVVLEPNFIAEIMRVFEDDTKGEVGGVSGTIVGDGYGPPSRLNALLLRALGGRMEGSYACRLVGPAINFYPTDGPDAIQPVEWLNGAAMAYRREAYLAERSWETFAGYSFMEDVHLSARVARRYRLLNTTRARLLHKCMGSIPQDWGALGESMILNRHAVVMHVLLRRRPGDYLRLFAYELLYCTMAQVKNPARPWRANLQLLCGKLRGVAKVLRGESPHRPYFA